jgi:hypothetical protein
MAGSTGLEPAASGVTGRRSNQLNYDPKNEFWKLWSAFAPRIGAALRRDKPSRIGASHACIAAGERRRGRYRIRTCDSRRVKPVLYH